MGLTTDQEAKLSQTLQNSSQALGIVEDIYEQLLNGNGRAEDIATGIAIHNNNTEAHSDLRTITNLIERKNEAGDDVAAAHRNIYRGKNMTNVLLLSALSTQLSSGDFSNLYIGDYWTLPVTVDDTTKNINFRIADFNYWKYQGDTSLTRNHVVFVPDTPLKNMQMQETNTTVGGVTASLVWTSLQDDLYEAVNAASCMNGHVLTHRNWFPVTMNPDIQSAAGGGLMGGMVTTAGEWKDVKLGLMSEPMVIGGTALTSTGYEVECAKTQFALFRLDPTWINGRASRYTWWLGAGAFSGAFVSVGGHGTIRADGASATRGVRPYFLFS